VRRVFCGVVAFFIASPALAGGDDDHDPAADGGDERVAELRAQGKACYRRRDYRCALARFEAAYALHPTPAMRFNVASAQDKLGVMPMAYHLYHRYLEEAGGSAPRRVRVYVGQRMKLLVRRIARLRIEVSPPDAEIRVDSALIPPERLRRLEGGGVELALNPGAYNLTLQRAGFAARSMAIKAEAGRVTPVNVALVAGPSFGSLRVVGGPAPASVWLDGRRMASSIPADIPRVATGRHPLRVLTDTHLFEEEVEIRANSRTETRAVLRLLRGQLTVQVMPHVAKVSIDGRQVGRSGVTVWDLAPGEHTVTARFAGHMPVEKRVSITTRTPRQLVSLTLERSVPLTIQSDPPGARVRIDGRWRGYTPGQFAVSRGPHEVALGLYNHREHRRTVDVGGADGYQLTARLTLEPEVARRLARRRRHLTWWGYGTLGVSAAAAATAAVLLGVGKTRGDENYESYQAARTEADRGAKAEEIEGAERLVTSGSVMLGAAALGLGISAYLLLSRTGEAPVVQPSVAGVTLGGRW